MPAFTCNIVKTISERENGFVKTFVREVKMFPRLIFNSGRRKIRKNSFVNFFEKDEKLLFGFSQNEQVLHSLIISA